MQCSIVREQLLEPVSLSDKVCGKNLAAPVLSCVLLSVAEHVLTVTATNLEVGVSYHLPVAASEDGVVAVSGTVLAQVLAALPSGTSLNLVLEGGFLVVQSAGGATKIAVHDPSDFPELPRVADAVAVSLPAHEFRGALTSVAYCASTSLVKPELASIFVHPDGGVLTTAATDSFRLAERRVPLKQPVSCSPFLIPAKSVADVLRVLDRAQGSVDLAVGEHQLALTFPGTYLTLRLTAGTFPDYTQIIPKEFRTSAAVLRADLERALRKAAIFSGQFSKTVLTIEPEEGAFTLHTESASVGEATDSVPATLSGDRATLSFNHRYLLDALQPIQSESVLLEVAGGMQPVLVHPVQDDTFRYLVMPMNR